MSEYEEAQPTRAEIDAREGPVVLAFGTNWCGYCLSAERFIAPAFDAHPEVPLIKTEDGPGRPLGRSFRVKLWPTLIFLRDGAEVARVARPTSRQVIDDAMHVLVGPDAAATPTP